MSLPNPRFESSYERLFGDNIAVGEEADPFFVAFYERFLRDPAVAGLFSRVDMRRQAQMVRKSLFQLASYYVLGDASAELKRIAALHRRVGLQPGMFDAWMAALLETVRQFDPECDEATLLAWGWAMAPGITYIRLHMETGNT
ncbi:MAG: globin [Pseudomonadales bacterium]|nr:globin [Pseudomonadales bacterium]MCP5182641.1 globin [Pseudomonadales bacterium]